MENNLYNLIQTINDKCLDLSVVLTDFDEVLANAVEIETIYDTEEGREIGTMRVLDEDAISELQKIYAKLDGIINK